jgi:hypothetical protein
MDAISLTAHPRKLDVAALADPPRPFAPSPLRPRVPRHFRDDMGNFTTGQRPRYFTGNTT